MTGDPDTASPTVTRAELRAFLADAPKPAALRNYGPTPTGADVGPGSEWHAFLAEHGFTCLHWPVEYGGRDASVAFQAMFAEECAYAGVPRQFSIFGPDLVGPVLIRYGTDEQKTRHLEPIRTGEHIWCQLFSEPEAGSDLASLRTRAEPTETGWRVDGQKVWSSGAADADFGILLARTGSEKHRGLSMFIVAMRSPGITVRPLRQIDGESKFNEVFLDGVELQAQALVGRPGQGWELALAMLGRERLTLGTHAVAMFRRLDGLIAAARSRGDLDPVLARSMTRLWARTWLLRYTWQRAVAGGDVTSAEFSVLKLVASETDRDLSDLATDVLGVDACIDPELDELVRHMLVGRAQTILGGTSEIQRNILAERVLKLPREPH
ncbi:Acyl-CoA dehydrogenase [Mycobacterium sp. 88mf]|nr:Acyl-CoA dehydrogenase [Mycobacterium sp. 88mf]SFF04922.1 Acyl-CoA dehydrogenase [Mycobacterium sp. 455mf]